MRPPPAWYRWLWYRTGYWFFALLYLFLYSYRAFGQHRTPQTGPLLVIANHESYWDPPVVGVPLKRRVAYMARKTLFNSKPLARFMHNVGTFAVDQEGTGLDGIRTALQKLKEGEAVVVFPEGTRTPDGTLQPFMPGIALLVRRAKVPVLPVGIAGPYDAWPIHARKPRFAPLWTRGRKARFVVMVGQPIPGETLAAMDARQITEYLQARVAELRDQAYRQRDHYAPAAGA